MSIEAFLVVVKSAIYLCEVEVYDEIGVVFRSRILADIETSEDGFEIIFFIDIVVIFEHREGKALAETARAYIEEIFIRSFYIFDKRSFIYIETILFYHILKILHAVWYAFAIDSLSSFSYLHSFNPPILIDSAAKIHCFFDIGKEKGGKVS